MSEGSIIEWLEKDDLVIVVGAYWNVVVTLIILFINLLLGNGFINLDILLLSGLVALISHINLYN